MKMIKQICSVGLFSFLASTALYADPWQFTLAPYIWGISLDGTVGVGNLQTNIHQNFDQLFKELNFAGMLFASAHKNNFGVYFNGIYTEISNQQLIGPLTVQGKNDLGIFDAGVSYKVFNKTFLNRQSISLEPYFGLRYTFNDTSLTIVNFDTFHNNQHWESPVLGTRLDYHFTPKWLIHLAGDLGGTDYSSNYTYSGTALLGYTPRTSVTTYLGYSYLKEHYQTGLSNHFYNWDVALYGPVLGVSINFS